MLELYKFFADPDTGQVVTLFLIGLLSFGIVYWHWADMGTSGKRGSNFQWMQIYFFGFIVFLSGALILGFMFTPRNAQDLLDIMRLTRVLKMLTIETQKVILFCIRLLM